MARTYTSAAKRAATMPDPTGDASTLLAWVGSDRARARQALRDLDAQPATATTRKAAETLLEVFPSFTLDGETFRVMGEVQLLDLCELMNLTKRNVKTVDPAAIAALADFFRGALGADEYERFREFVRVNCVDPDVLNDVMEGIVEDLTEVPTSRPSHSVPGPSNSGPTSKVVSLSQRSVQESPMSTDAFRDYLQRQQKQATPLIPTTETRGFVSFG